jgi:hypothetical protein
VTLTDIEERNSESSTLKNLKRDLEDERRASAELRESVRRLQDAVDEMRAEFAMQLSQAEAKTKSAEDKIMDQSARLTALGGGREATMRSLKLTQQELAVAKSERDELLKRLSATERMQTETVALTDDTEGDPESDPATDSDAPSIDQLMASLNDMMEDKSSRSESDRFSDTPAESAQSEWQEMLAPELIAPEAFSESDEEDSPIQRSASRLLVFIDAEQPIKYPLFKEFITIGRSEDADIQIEGDFISRIHARVVCGDKETLVEDVGSKNGIKVNGERVERHALSHGDVLAIGRLRFTFIDSAAQQ